MGTQAKILFMSPFLSSVEQSWLPSLICGDDACTVADSEEGSDVINEELRGGELWLLILGVSHPPWKSHHTLSVEAGSLP